MTRGTAWGLLLAILSGVGIAALWGGQRSERADFVLANGTEPRSLDPHQVTGSPGGRVLRALFEGLTVSHPRTLEPLPGMAESWEVSEDGQLYRFRLRGDSRWSNGDPVTAADFLRSWQRLLDPERASAYAYLLWPVAGAREYQRGERSWDQVGLRVPTPGVFEVELSRPVPYFLDLTSFFALYPVHPQLPVTPDRVIGNGPFRLQERRLRNRLRLVKNPGYWDRDRVEIDTIDVLAAESANTMLNLFVAGGADWIVKVPRPVVGVLRLDPRFTPCYRPTPYFGTAFYRFNTTRPPFDDARVRRALTLAVDRREIVDRVCRAGEVPACSFVPWPAAAVRQWEESTSARTGEPVTFPVPVAGYRRACVSRHGVVASPPPGSWSDLAHDPEQARRLLRECGFSSPAEASGRPFPPFELLYNSDPLNQMIAEVIQAQWRRELGLRVRLRQQEWGSYLSDQRGLRYDVSRSSWIGDYLDPNTFLDVFVGDGPNNRTGWRHEEYDELIDRAASEADPSRRAELLHAAERILMRELPLLPLYYYVTDGMVAESILGLEGNVLDRHFPKFIRRRGAP